MAGPEVWQQLSQSSKKALRWAAAAALARAERNGTSLVDAEVDEFDLLVGIMLAHPSDSEPRALVEHVGATAADLLPPDYPMPTSDVLQRHISTVPADGPPLLSADAEGALAATTSYVGDAGVVELRVVFGGLMRGQNRVHTAVLDLVSKAGLSGVVESYEEYLRQGDEPNVSQSAQADLPPTDYAWFLRQRHPYRAEPVEVPTYKPDHGPGSMGDDYVDIRSEVDAFAYLLASRALQPPLAVGLFGDWGSGKSYFMDALRSRIEQLVRSDAVTTQPQKDLPFWKRVIQIEFNAWHYVDGDLWASLVEHVFSQLKAHDDENQTEVAKRQKYWLGKIDEKLRERGDLDLAKVDKDADLEEAKAALDEAKKQRREKLASLAEAEKKAAAGAMLTSSLVTLRVALSGLVDAKLSGETAEALGALEEARAELKRGIGVVRGFRPWHVLIIAAVPVLVWLLGEVELPGAAQVFGGISALLAAVTGALRSATGQVRSRLDQLDEAAAAVRAEAETKRQALEDEVEEAREKVVEAKAAVDELTARQTTLETEIAQLDKQVAGVTSGALLSEFVTERVGSVDYRTRLGTAALVQRDFRALSKLIDEQNDECLLRDTGKAPGPEVLNRIILYVDDLDRCEAKRVVEVLQAVHLLLAFPLFVVVVAVDSRWLSQSLEKHYPALVRQPGDKPEDQHATPADYLEKIFQVPFWVQPLGPSARGSMVRGLLQGNLRGTSGGDDVVSEDEALVVDDQQREMLDALFTHRTAIKMQTAALTVTADELKFLDGLGVLLGVTPRSIKRFVNVYQLLCGLPPVPLGPDTPPYEELVAFLLAVTDGQPELIVELRKRIAEQVKGETLAGAIATIRSSTTPPVDLTRYDAWIKDHPAWDTFPLTDLAVPAERVRRFSFR